MNYHEFLIKQAMDKAVALQWLKAGRAPKEWDCEGRGFQCACGEEAIIQPATWVKHLVDTEVITHQEAEDMYSFLPGGKEALFCQTCREQWKEKYQTLFKFKHKSRPDYDRTTPSKLGPEDYCLVCDHPKYLHGKPEASTDDWTAENVGCRSTWTHSSGGKTIEVACECEMFIPGYDLQVPTPDPD